MGILNSTVEVMHRDISRILDTSPDKLRRRESHVHWKFEYVDSLDDGWLIRATNHSDFTAQLDVQFIEFYLRDGAVQELLFLTPPLVNPGESVNLKFSVRFEGKLVATGGELRIGLALAAADELRLRSSVVELPDLESL